MCETYSIWKCCPPPYFALVYWLVLFVSSLGSIYYLYGLSSLLQNKYEYFAICRRKKVHVLLFKILRRYRCVGALIMFNSWVLLILATVTVTPDDMDTWLKTSAIVLVLEFSIWCIEVFWGTRKFELMKLFSFVLFILNILCVRFIQGVFYKAIESNNVEDLILWKKSKK